MAGLTDAAGRFPEDVSAFVRRLARRSVPMDEVEAELDAQIVRVLEAGLRPTHLDSHQHLHALPAVRRVVVRLAANHDIAAVRRSAERPRDSMLL